MDPEIARQAREEEAEEDYKQASYKDLGRLLFFIDKSPRARDDTVEVLAVEGSAELMMFPEYWVRDEFEIELTGFYVIEGIVGHYHKGDFWAGEDDDETWECSHVRRATTEEIENECLF